MNRIKKLIEESIMIAIDNLSERIARCSLEDENHMNAESIKLLAEAYDMVHRGKKGDY